MKKLQSIYQLKRFEITPKILVKINGGERKATSKSDEEIELG